VAVEGEMERAIPAVGDWEEMATTQRLREQEIA